MNLTALETFYEEKRPFFLEGKHIFDFSADNNLVFYSRRIGHVPSYSPPADNTASFSQNPEFTNIIDAVKLSGTTRNGISVGILQSTTQEERAKLTEDGVETQPVVEPLTNFLIARIQKTTNKGNTQIGTMLTSTNRFINDPQLEFLPRNAYTAGIDLLTYSATVSTSSISGHLKSSEREEEAMITSSEMLFTITSVPMRQVTLRGQYHKIPDWNRGYISAGRQGNKRFVFSEKISWWSPGFDLNDVGYLLMADVIENQTLAGIRQTEPGKLLRNYTLTLVRKTLDIRRVKYL